MNTKPPALSPEERAENLRLAIASRRDRSEMKQAINQRRASIFDAINDPRESIRRLKVVDPSPAP